MVARRAHNPKVGSSNLPFATVRPRERSLTFMYVSIFYVQRSIYIGYTGNMQERLVSHNELGKKGWTIKRELKFAKSRAWIWSEIIGKLK